MDDTQSMDCRTLLRRWRDGDLCARDELFACLYSELRQISAGMLRAERHSSLATDDLVNEAAIRLLQLDRIDWADKSHFLALAARAMRRILIDHARRKNSDKRRHKKVTLVTRMEGVPGQLDFDVLEKSLIRLNAIDSAKADIVELRYFGGLSLPEIAEVTGTSESTVKRQWRIARAWLADAMAADPRGT